MNRKPDYIDDIGTKYWYDEDGKLHNDDDGFPAVISFLGSKVWYKHGLRHNENGPAQIYSDGSKAWYINGKEYTEKEFLQYKIKNFINE